MTDIPPDAQQPSGLGWPVPSTDVPSTDVPSTDVPPTVVPRGTSLGECVGLGWPVGEGVAA